MRNPYQDQLDPAQARLDYLNGERGRALNHKVKDLTLIMELNGSIASQVAYVNSIKKSATDWDMSQETDDTDEVDLEL